MEAVEIRLDPGTAPHQAPVSLFGSGTITFHVEGLFRTSPGWNLWVGGPPNAAKDGIAPLRGVIETDWSPYSFTMNWRFTRPGEWVRWEEDEAFCFFFPIERGVLEDIRPELRPLAEAPELASAFATWSASRDAFQEHVRQTRPSAPADKWQKLYYRGVGPQGEPGAADHESKLRLAAFAPAPSATQGETCPARPAAASLPAPAAKQPPASPAIFAQPQAAAVSASPVLDRQTLDFTLRNIGFDPDRAAPATPTVARQRPPQPPARVKTPPPPAKAPEQPARPATTSAWILEAMERQRALAPSNRSVPRVRDLPAEDFLERFYAAGQPVVIEGAINGWPALSRWIPDYLARIVGATPIEYQGERTGDPDFELYKDRHTRRMPFDRFVAAAARGGGNDAYLTAYNSAANRAALAPLFADLGTIDRYLTGPEGMLWIGPQGTFTPLHFDLTNNLLAQIVGRKWLVLLPPSETWRLANHRHVFSDVHDVTDAAHLARHPQAQEARRFKVEIGPGDLLYMPVGWWHQVRSLAFSAMLTYTNFRWPNDAYLTFPDGS